MTLVLNFVDTTCPLFENESEPLQNTKSRMFWEFCGWFYFILYWVNPLYHENKGYLFYYSSSLCQAFFVSLCSIYWVLSCTQERTVTIFPRGEEGGGGRRRLLDWSQQCLLRLIFTGRPRFQKKINKNRNFDHYLEYKMQFRNRIYSKSHGLHLRALQWSCSDFIFKYF